MYPVAANINPISIHVPREGHDAVALIMPAIGLTISIHVPREGHDEYSELYNS